MKINKTKSVKVGSKFGKLTVRRISKTDEMKRAICTCECECGKTIECKIDRLIYDNKKSCGCSINRGCRTHCQKGEKYGILTVVESWTEKRNNKTSSKEKYCRCQCDCGNFITVKARYIRKGHKSSCGCLRNICNSDHRAWKGYGEISSTVWRSIIGSSNRRSREIKFEITIEQAWELFLKQERKCAISGEELVFAKRAKDKPLQTASLDRIDSNGHYTIDNIQWIHKSLNLMKMNLDQDLFINWCRKVVEFQKEKNDSSGIEEFEGRELH